MISLWRFAMLKRKITDQLKDWKDHHSKSALLVRGARQVGKTFIIRDFGKKYYSSVVELNFEKEKELRGIFEGSLAPDYLIQQMSLFLPGSRFIPGKTLIFFDEIQSCPDARTAVKFLAEDNRFDVIESGSLLGINYKDVSSYPVGYELPLDMYPLDFEEFLWAIGIDESAISGLHAFFRNPSKIPGELNDRMLSYLRQYIVIGGMPKVVDTFTKTNNYNDVFSLQQAILSNYSDDITKYARVPDKPKIRECFHSIPAQLAKENTKFQYALVEKHGSARKFGGSIEWLRDAGIIQLCHNVSMPSFPLNAYEKPDQFRVYMTDIGLLTAMYGYEMKAAVIQDTLTGPAKGGIYENLIASVFSSKGIPLYYYRTDNGSVEIEFLITEDSSVVPVEVKAKRGGTTSLNKILEEKSVKKGYKLTSTNAGVSGKKITLPLYMAIFL